MDNIYLFDVAIVVFGLMLSAFFSATEAAILSIPVNRMKQLADEDTTLGHAMNFVMKKPSEVLTTILVGNNFVNISVAAYTTKVSQQIFKSQAEAVAIGITTLLVLFFGEIIPKTFGRNIKEKNLAPFINIIKFLYYFPLSFIFVSVFTVFIKLVLGKRAHLIDRIITKDDIEFMVSEAEKVKSIDTKQINLLNSILEFSSIRVRDIMVPRQQIHAIKREATYDEVIQTVREVTHSRYPVYHESLDQILGFMHVKDLAFVDDIKTFDVSQFIKEPFFVYDHMKIQAVFDHMNKMKVHLALVKNEIGLVVGIITLEDIMEEIMGEIQDEHDDEDDIDGPIDADLPQDKIIVEASISLRDLASDYNVKLPMSDSYSTLAGFILDKLGNNFPQTGNIIIYENFRFILTKVVHKEIKMVQIESSDNDKTEHYDNTKKESNDESSGSNNTSSVKNEEASHYAKYDSKPMNKFKYNPIRLVQKLIYTSFISK